MEYDTYNYFLMPYLIKTKDYVVLEGYLVYIQCTSLTQFITEWNCSFTFFFLDRYFSFLIGNYHPTHHSYLFCSRLRVWTRHTFFQNHTVPAVISLKFLHVQHSKQMDPIAMCWSDSSKPIRIKVVEYLMFGFRTCSPTFRLPTIPSLLCKCNILSPGKQMWSDS